VRHRSAARHVSGGYTLELEDKEGHDVEMLDRRLSRLEEQDGYAKAVTRAEFFEKPTRKRYR
jgi:ribosomal protein S21